MKVICEGHDNCKNNNCPHKVLHEPIMVKTTLIPPFDCRDEQVCCVHGGRRWKMVSCIVMTEEKKILEHIKDGIINLEEERFNIE